MKKKVTLEPDALENIVSHDWPGNVRELKNLAERIAVMHQGKTISGDEIIKLLNKKMKKPANSGKSAPPQALLSEIYEQNYNEAKDSFEKNYLEFQLFKNNGIISRTAEAIGVYPSNLHAKLRKYNITTTNIREE
jgi:two-component system nitrogen regulation response regulator NtrX